MTVFIYSAADQSGKVSKGEREAGDQKALAQALRAEGFLLLEAAEKKGIGAIFRIDLGQAIARIRPITLVEKMFFSRNLSVMIAAGLPLTRGLEALAEETTNPKLRKVITDIKDSVVKGKSFADSLRQHEKIFGELVINMVEVGETTGKLTLVLKLLANQMKRDYTLRKRVWGAMAYPAIIVAALLGVGSMMMLYVVPTLAATIKELGVPLPLTTRLIIVLSEALLGYGLLIAVLLAATAVGSWRLYRTAGGKELFDRLSLKIPFFGPLVRKFNTARLCRTLAYLVTSGVPIIRSLEISSGVLSNTVFRRALVEAAVGIQRGKMLNVLLAGYPGVFPPLVTQMIAVGEETGKLSEMLLRLALFFEEEVANTTKNLSTVIEPILMIIVGAAVGFFAVSMLQPIYSSLGSIGI